MAITTYAELQTTVANYLARSDLTSYIPDFITMAESGFNRDVRHRRMVTTTTLATVGGTATVALPSDYLESRTAVLSTDPKVVLSYVTPQQLATNWTSASDQGKPTEYTIIGQNIKLGKTPDAVYSIDFEYYQRIPALSGSNTTNWLLTLHPDVYVFGSLLQATPFIMADARVPMWGSFLQRALEGLGLEGQRGTWAGSPMSARVDVTVG